MPPQGLENGHLRFLTRSGGGKTVAPEHDPHALDLWGLSKKEHTAVLVAAAVLVALAARGEPERSPGALDKAEAPAQLPLPPAPAPQAASADDPDALLRRLRELGELHREGCSPTRSSASPSRRCCAGLRRPERAKSLESPIPPHFSSSVPDIGQECCETRPRDPVSIRARTPYEP